MSFLRLMEETIQENESVGTGEVTDTIKTPPPTKKHTVNGLIREMWPAYLIEIIVIILGISITLALEEWRDSVKESKLETIYLKNLLADVDVDFQSLKIASDRTQQLLNRGNELLGTIRNPTGKDSLFASINEDVRAILDRPKFISSDATFSDLKSSGNLHLIKDIGLKNLLFAYYNEAQHIREIQDAEQQATIIISGSYFMKLFSLDDQARQSVIQSSGGIPEILNSTEFENNVYLRVTNRQELLDIYQRTDTLAVSLKNELVKKIGE